MPNNDKCCLVFYFFWFELLLTEPCLDNNRLQVKGLEFDTKPYHLTKHESAANAECVERLKCNSESLLVLTELRRLQVV